MGANLNDDLVGNWVLINPEVYFNEENKVGYTGTLASADVEDDRFYVDLGGAEPKLFASDWLMVLKPQADIYGYLNTHLKTLGRQEIVDLYSIHLLQDSGEPKDLQKALEMASGNPAIRSATLITLEQFLVAERNNDLNLDQGAPENTRRSRGL